MINRTLPRLCNSSSLVLQLPSSYSSLQRLVSSRFLQYKYSKSGMAGDYAFTFGSYKISSAEVFYSTPLSYAMVNLRPVLPGLKRFVDLTADETIDLWATAKKVGAQLEIHHKASSLTFTIQDGPQAGQTVKHVHVHILPRKSHDFENNDEIYEAIDEKEKELKEKLDLDKERKDRTHEEMAREAEEYRLLFL